MNLTPDEIVVLIRAQAEQVSKGQLDPDMDRPRAPRKTELVAKIERMLQLAKELP